MCPQGTHVPPETHPRTPLESFTSLLEMTLLGVPLRVEGAGASGDDPRGETQESWGCTVTQHFLSTCDHVSTCVLTLEDPGGLRDGWGQSKR